MRGDTPSKGDVKSEGLRQGTTIRVPIRNSTRHGAKYWSGASSGYPSQTWRFLEQRHVSVVQFNDIHDYINCRNEHRTCNSPHPRRC